MKKIGKALTIIFFIILMLFILYLGMLDQWWR